jgi:site-specific recombinase XerD
MKKYEIKIIKERIEFNKIQELLEHRSSKTTEIYTHVSNKSLRSIMNPLDNLNKGGNIEDKQHL